MSIPKSLLTLVALSMFLSANIFAQTLTKSTVTPAQKTDSAAQSDEDYQLKGKNEFSVWGGFSPDTTTALHFGSSVNARYGTIGVRYARRFDNGNKVNWKYTADIIPFSNLSFLNKEFVQTAPNRFQLTDVRRNASAFGFVPLGFQANFRPKKRLRPFVNGGGGILFFNKSIPNDLGKKTNFILEAGGGLEIGFKNNRAMTIGYKITHISNAYRGEINPGYDNNIFYLGYSFSRR